MASINRNLIQYWHSGAPPADVADLIRGLRAVNGDLRHRCHNEVSADRFLGEFLPPEVRQSFRACGVPAMGADLFRYAALYVHGGFWADVDWVAHAPLSGLVQPETTAALVLRDNGVIANHLFYVRDPGHPLLRLVLELAVWTVRQRLAVGVWLATGPGLFTYLHRACVMRTNNPRRLAPELFAPGAPDDQESRDTRRWLRQLCTWLPLRSSGMDLIRPVQILPEAQLGRFLRYPDPPPAYQQTAQHWTRWSGSIYRRSPPLSSRPRTEMQE